MMNKPTIQVQAVIYNNDRDALEKAIDALANAVRVAEINGKMIGRVSLVYGDASPEAVYSPEDVSRINSAYDQYLDFQYRVFGFNSGYGKGNNLLAMESTADYLVIMNPDIIVSPRYLMDTLAPFEDAQVGLVEARQTPVEHHKEYNVETKETGWSSGACFMIPTALFQKLGGFDSDTFFMYCEDVDLSWRIRLAGYKLYYQPLSPVFHAKYLRADGKWQPTYSEVYYSAISSVLLPYKWSRTEIARSRMEALKNSDSQVHQEAAAYLETLREENRLPGQIDAEHAVGTFLGGYYAENRFVL